MPRKGCLSRSNKELGGGVKLRIEAPPLLPYGSPINSETIEH